MTHQADRYEWVSVNEASRRLTRSVSTIRRMIESGELVGEREPLGGSRDRYRVRLPVETPQDASGAPQASESDNAPPDASEAPQATSDATTRLLDALEGRDAAFDALHQSYARLYGELADARERAGRAEARNELLEAQATALRLDLERAHAELADERARPWWKWWR